MAYKVDTEKEELVRICESQGTETSKESFKINDVNFDFSTRKCVINYTQIAGKRTVKKRFTYMGVQYKLLNDWTYTNKSATKILILTNKAIEELNEETDKIVVAAKPKIIKALPESLKPSWVKANADIEKLNKEVKKKKKALDTEYKEAMEAKKQIDKYKQLLTENTAQIKTKETTLNKAKGNLEKAKSELDKLEDSFFNRLFKGYEINTCKQKCSDFICEIEKIEKTLNQLKSEISFYESEIKRLNTRYMPLIGEKRAKENNIYKWSKEEEKKIKAKYKPLPEKVNTPNKTKTEIKPVAAGPTEEWKKEERRKLGRVYADGLTLRDYILKRDNYTCQSCGNSTKIEPNLLLEVDHITPVSKYGPSIPENLQTLCWKCNRAKSDK